MKRAVDENYILYLVLLKALVKKLKTTRFIEKGPSNRKKWKRRGVGMRGNYSLRNGFFQPDILFNGLCRESLTISKITGNAFTPSVSESDMGGF